MSLMKHQRGLIIFILLIAAALRLSALPDVPFGLHYDEAANVILTQQIAAGDYRPMFIHAYTGKEVLFFYATAPWVWITNVRAGLSRPAAWGLRLGAAMLGTLTVAATYAATRALFGTAGSGATASRARWTATLAAGWLAVAFPHVLLSRYGFRAISQPLLQALTVAALWHGLRTGKRRWLIMGGIFLGLTGYTYLAARLFPIPLGLALAVLLWHTPAVARRRRLGHLSLALGAACLAFAPLGWHFLQNPATFTTRIGQVAATTWIDALHGIWLCVRALVWPGDGDPYVRFNVSGRPVLDAVSALLALIGLGALLFRPQRTVIERASRSLILSALLVMLLPSALATAEITPSNLRLVGLWPFLAMLPAYGLVSIFNARVQGRQDAKFFTWASTGLLLMGALATGYAYHQWATSAALFYAADGEMALVARVLDVTDLHTTTVYIASEHYRHPTVAALSRQYSQAKWLTGGATWVLPPTGDALTLIPRSQSPPAPWPEAFTQNATPYLDPDGHSALWAYYLSADTLTALRATASTANITPSTKLAHADFAHVVQVYDVHLTTPCHVAEPCTVMLTWEARAPYPALEPVVRLVHPETGEWARTMAFHYPPEQWTQGDIVLDQLTFTPPIGTPPGNGYQISVGWYNPDSGVALPRLENERFAGLEARFPSEGLSLAPQTRPPTPADADNVGHAAACTHIDRPAHLPFDGGRLLGWRIPPASARPGERLPLTLCWQASANAPTTAAPPITLRLSGPETLTLYNGPLTAAYGCADWRSYEMLEGRYTLRLPKTMADGKYTLTLQYGDAELATLHVLQILPLERNFTPPAPQQPLAIDFGGQLRLLGYDAALVKDTPTLNLTLYWETITEVTPDYVVFIHVVDTQTQAVIAQMDEEPQRGHYPTSLWIAGEIVADTHTLNLPAGVTAGNYTLRVGLYIPENGQHLRVGGAEFVILPRK